jgi:hypothetical protein
VETSLCHGYQDDVRWFCLKINLFPCGRSWPREEWDDTNHNLIKWQCAPAHQSIAIRLTGIRSVICRPAVSQVTDTWIRRIECHTSVNCWSQFQG